MKLEQWFTTPIWYGMLENIAESQYCDAVNFCKNLSHKSPGRKLSNVGGWQSEPYNLEGIMETPLAVFIEQLKPWVTQSLHELGVVQDINISDVWININHKNNTNTRHLHPAGSVSGVFYLTHNLSKIVFERNLDINHYHLLWLKSNLDTPLSFKEITYSPSRGQYLIFPSWLVHRVEPNLNDEERISVAFNVGIND
jgi:uncharacterized protein (TIGR02466 family)